MRKTKLFKQYSGDSFLINVVIGIKGNISQKSHLRFYGNYYKEYNKKYELSIKEHRKKWRELHKKERKEYNKKYDEQNKDKIKERKRQYYLNNKSYINERIKKYRKTPAGKIVQKRNDEKRKGFSFNPLNNPFTGCEGHHLNYEDVIFIPKDLHRSVSHSVTQNRNMHKINNLAIDYYWEEKFK